MKIKNLMVYFGIPIVYILLLSLVSADFGIDNPTIPHINSEPVTTTTISINETLFNTNSSDFWDNLDTPSDITIFCLLTGCNITGDLNVAGDVSFTGENFEVNATQTTFNGNATFNGPFETNCMHCEDNNTYFHNNVTIKGTLDVGTFLTPYAQVVTVAKSGADFTTIQGAIDSITDATTTKRYLVKVQSGIYVENIVMKDYVDVIGAGRTNTIISCTVGTCLTFPATKGTVSEVGILANYGTMGAESTAILSNGADSALLLSDVIVTKSGGDFIMHGISVTGGAFRMRESRFDYSITGATTGTAFEQSAFSQTGALTIFLLHNNELLMTCNDRNDDLVGFETLAGSVGSYLLQNNIIFMTNTAPSGTATGIYLHGTATGATFSANRLTVTSPTAYGLWIESDGGTAIVNTRSNEIIISGAVSKTSYVNAGDTWNSAFDKITATGGDDTTGGGTIFKVSSLTPGSLTISNNLTLLGNTISNGTATWTLQELNRTSNSTYNNLLNQNCPAGKIVNGTLANGTFICTTDATGSGGADTRWLNDSIDEYINSSYPQGLRVNGSDYSNFTFIGKRCGGTPTPCSEHEVEEVCIQEESGGCYWNCVDEMCNDYSCQGIPNDCTYHPPSTCTNFNGCVMVEDDTIKFFAPYGDIQQKGTKVALAGGVLSDYEFTLTGSRGAECDGDFCVAIGDSATASESGIALGAGATAFSSAVAIADCLADNNGVCIGADNEVAAYSVAAGQSIYIGGQSSTGVGYYGYIAGSNSIGIATVQFGGSRWSVSGDFSGLIGTKQSDEITLLDVIGDRSILVGNAKLGEDNALYGSDSLALMSYGYMYGNNSVCVGWNLTQSTNNAVELGWGKVQMTMNTTGIEMYENVTFDNLIQLKLITLPACGAVTNGSIGRNNTGVYGCATNSAWVKLF